MRVTVLDRCSPVAWPREGTKLQFIMQAVRVEGCRFNLYYGFQIASPIIHMKLQKCQNY